MKPLNNNIAVEVIKETTINGLIRLNGDESQPTKGVVKYVGNKVMDVTVGDTVLIPTWGNTEVTHNGMDLLLVRENDVMGIIY